MLGGCPFLCKILGEKKNMELNEMEKRMLYQTEGSEKYAILHELAMASRYGRKAAGAL